MKIAWFTPFCRASSIGRRSAEIVRQLRAVAEVDVWCPSASDLWDTEARVVPFRDLDGDVLQRLKAYDLAVYNLGNYAPYHAQIFRVSEAHPGVVILHDYVMVNFFYAYVQSAGHRTVAMRLLLEKHYGYEASKSADNPRLCEAENAIKYPLCEAAVTGSLGAVVHSDYVAVRIERLGVLPVQKLALSCEALRGVPICAREELSLSEDDFVIVSAGHVNRNKRVDAVLEAIGTTPTLKRSTKYIVIGPSDPGYQLELDRLVVSYGLQDQVHFTGFVSDEILESYLSHANICVNLRHPSLEGASGSALEQMMHGKPVIVSRSGWFNELPEDVVIKVNPADEVKGVRAALLTLLGSPDRRRELGEAGRSYVMLHCSPQLYAEGFLRFAQQVRRYAPLLGLADRLAVTLNSLGIDGESSVVRTASEECANLFGRRGKKYDSEC
jgi:glycosyltransferase involved in cell wall biosynthesis